MRHKIEIALPVSSGKIKVPSDFDIDLDAAIEAIRAELKTVDLPLTLVAARLELDLRVPDDSGSTETVRVTRLKSFVWSGETL